MIRRSTTAPGKLGKAPWPKPASPYRPMKALVDHDATLRSTAPGSMRDQEEQLLRSSPVLMAMFNPREAKYLASHKYGEECRTEAKF
jgi:hypothetical protein